MKSEAGSLTSSGQVYHFTFHAAEGPHREGAVKERAIRARSRTSWLMSLWRIGVSSIPHGQRAVPSATAASLRLRCVHDFRRRGRCVYTVNVDVPLDSVLVWFAIRSPIMTRCKSRLSADRKQSVMAVPNRAVVENNYKSSWHVPSRGWVQVWHDPHCDWVKIENNRSWHAPSRH